jgi:hypothetical protein
VGQSQPESRWRSDEVRVGIGANPVFPCHLNLSPPDRLASKFSKERSSLLSSHVSLPQSPGSRGLQTWPRLGVTHLAFVPCHVSLFPGKPFRYNIRSVPLRPSRPSICPLVLGTTATRYPWTCLCHLPRCRARRRAGTHSRVVEILKHLVLRLPYRVRSSPDHCRRRRTRPLA